ncbi:hypothetical protein GOODEAATRI_033891 [Goodea atripinnis]|uniref:Uncharacterized protein n=1 Tax=Goodea atripinnis TaxID=208336 RepID=A0ABV0NQC9_9TELE
MSLPSSSAPGLPAQDYIPYKKPYSCSPACPPSYVGTLMLRHQASQREQKETTAACSTHPADLLHSGSTNPPNIYLFNLKILLPCCCCLGSYPALNVAIYK